MEQQRNILFIIFLVLTLFLFWAWERDELADAQRAEIEAQNAELMADVQDADSIGRLITLQSDSLKLTIDLNGGDIIDARLLKVLQEQGSDEPFHLLMEEPNFVYIAMSGFAGTDGPDAKARPTYDSAQNSYVLAESEDSVSAVLTFTQDGVTYEKIYTLNRDSYVVDVTARVNNQSERDLSMLFYGQLKQTVDFEAQSNAGAFGFVAGAYRGSAYSTDSSRYEKNKFDELVELAAEHQNINTPTRDGWVAMIQHYFVAAWIGGSTDNVIYSNQAKDGRDAVIGIRTTPTTIAAGGSHDFTSRMWIGPKNQDQMEDVAPNLDLTVDYGWLWFLSIPLFKIMEFIHSFVGNWGFSIILLTLIVRSVLFPLTKAQYTSMAKMRLLTPKMQELRERYKDDRQKLGQETMRLYRSEKVNPLGGCFPLVIQMPIFIALYWTLMESTELRHAPFIFWITDLSVHDPYFVTPILYGVTMFFIQKMSPTPVNDPIQRKVFMAMPLVFTFMFCTFPAGLTLYWLVSNCFTILQQIVIFRSLEKKGLQVRQPKKTEKA